MEDNIFAILTRAARKMLVYEPPPHPSRFVLAEGANDERQPTESQPRPPLPPLAGLEALLRYARRLAAFGDELISALRQENVPAQMPRLKQDWDALVHQYGEIAPLFLGYLVGEEGAGRRPVSACLEENRRIIQLLYDLPRNRDLVVRSFAIAAKPPVKAMLVYFDGLSDKGAISRVILDPLMLGRITRQPLPEKDPLVRLGEQFLPAGAMLRAADFAALQEGINSGDAALFVEGAAEAALIDVKGMEHRGVERPLTEQSVRGSQNSFTEALSTNTALIRSTLKASDLVTETLTIGARSRSKCAVMYVRSLADSALVAEVKRRIGGIQTDYLADTGVLEQFIEDSPFNPFPQTLSTERPDRVAVHLAEGRVAILLDGSPFVLVVPVTFLTLLHAPDDYSLKFPYGSLIRITRTIGMLIAVLLPSLYLATSIFHQEAIPTDLLLAIATARQQVPFPSVVEILLMEIAFELIREGGVRIPGFLGPTIGIVGAIILGQAAVMAKIVSPVLIIIIAFTGLASYTIPDYRLSNSLRMTRFLFLAVGAAFGFVGIATGLLLWIASLVNLKSFGVPYFAPIAPKTFFGHDFTLRGPVFSQEIRPDYLNPRDARRQPSVSRTWIEDPPEGRGEK
jgi:spore germination protein KA